MQIRCIVDYGYLYKESYTLYFRSRIYPIEFSTFLYGLRRILNISQQQKVRRIHFTSSNIINCPHGIYEPYWNLTHPDP